MSNMAVELPLDVLAGPTFDGLDVITGAGEAAADQKAFQLWALLLNHGRRLAATASSDACFDRPGDAGPGAARLYTFVEGPFSIAAAAQAAARGRTFATTGPLVLASVDRQPPGSSFPANGSARELRVEAWASGATSGGLARVEIDRPGLAVDDLGNVGRQALVRLAGGGKERVTHGGLSTAGQPCRVPASGRPRRTTNGPAPSRSGGRRWQWSQPIPSTFNSPEPTKTHRPAPAHSWYQPSTTLA